MGGPSSKAKYSWLTDSEPVLWRKGEKNPCEGSEIEPETVYPKPGDLAMGRLKVG